MKKHPTMTQNIRHLKQYQGSSPRQKLEIARMKLQRVQADTNADPADVQQEVTRLQSEIRDLESQLNPPPTAA